MKILIATEKPFATKAIDTIAQKIAHENYEFVLLERYTQKTELLDAISDADAIIVRSDIIDREIIQAGKKLKVIVRAGAGYDNIDIEAATQSGICVMNTPGQNANGVAELFFGLLIATVRNFYNGTAGTELKGKTIGIHAYGNIGRNIARIAKGFQMNILAYDAYCTPESLIADGVEPTKSASELYQKSDIISINMPLTTETDKVVNQELLKNLHSEAILINTARKEVINESHILEHLLAHPNFKYITDITPDNVKELKEKCPNQFYTTPKKMGAQTAEANLNAGVAAAQQIIDFLQKGEQKYRVNITN